MDLLQKVGVADSRGGTLMIVTASEKANLNDYHLLPAWVPDPDSYSKEARARWGFTSSSGESEVEILRKHPSEQSQAARTVATEYFRTRSSRSSSMTGSYLEGMGGGSVTSRSIESATPSSRWSRESSGHEVVNTKPASLVSENQLCSPLFIDLGVTFRQLHKYQLCLSKTRVKKKKEKTRYSG